MITVEPHHKPSKMGRRGHDLELREEAKSALTGGADYKSVSRMLNVPEATLMAWASKYKWPVPNRVKMLSVQSAERRSKEIGSKEKPPSSGVIMAESLDSIGERNAILVATRTSELLAKSLKDILQPPKDWTEATQAVNIVQKVTGRDKPAQTNIQLNLGNWKRPEFKVSENGNSSEDSP